MRAPGQAKSLAHLRHAHPTGQGPEVQVGQRTVHRLQRRAVLHFATVGSYHVGSGGQAGSAAELGQHLAAQEHAFCAQGSSAPMPLRAWV